MLARSPNDTFAINQLISMPSFKIYNDGIGINGYSFRLSNVSFNNWKNNNAYLIIWVANMTVVAARDIVGLVSNDEKTHYRISPEFGMYAPPAHFKKEWIINHLNESNCNVSFDQLRQNEYYDLSSIGIYRKENYYKGYVLDLNLNRGRFEPIQQFAEDCLKNLVNTASLIWENEVAGVIKSNDDIFAGQMEQVKQTVKPFLYAGLGLFALGAAGYAANQWQKSRNRLSSTSLNAEERLADIKYEGEIDPDFICPISRTIMNDPVIANDGKTYDRSGLETWYKIGSGISPFNENIQIDWYEIKPNYVLREKIEKFVSDSVRQYEENQQQKKRI